MSASTYRLVVVGSLLSSFLTGMHMPVFHEVIEHGAPPRMSVLVATLILVILTLLGGWSLLRQARRL
jgi:hypothetical protein